MRQVFETIASIKASDDERGEGLAEFVIVLILIAIIALTVIRLFDIKLFGDREQPVAPVAGASSSAVVGGEAESTGSTVVESVELDEQAPETEAENSKGEIDGDSNKGPAG